MNRKVSDQLIDARSILQQVLEDLGLTSGFSRHNIIHLWPSIVNTTIARHTKAERISGSTLHVVVDSSVWMNEMANVKKILLGKINACLGKDAAPLTDIRFQQRSWARHKEAPAAASVVEPELDRNEMRLIEKSLEPIQNDDLRNVLARIREKDLRLNRKRRRNA